MILKKLGKDLRGEYFLEVPAKIGYEKRKVNTFPINLPETHRIITHPTGEEPSLSEVEKILTQCSTNYSGMPVTAYHPEIISINNGETRTRILFFWLSADFF
jgi:hypothetical protein